QTQLPGIAPWSKISSIDLSPLDPATAYVAVDGQRIDDWRPHVFRTHDGGRSWTEVSRGLPAGEVVSVVRADPVRKGLLYAGNETSVFVSFDDGDSWQPLRQNLPTAWARDLLVHGDDLVVATQGRAIWILGDLALLRQLGEGGRQAPRLFSPAAAYRVRSNNNHDTPLAPETPVGQNPPQGAVIDYWLPSAAKGPVTLEIRDASGVLVRRFSSTDKPMDIPAERYFAADWVKPEPVLGAAPGAHRWVWDLRRPRPKAVTYNYSIAAVWGLDTPLDPQGQIVEPGRYTAVLTVDGRSQTASFDVLPDPRVTGADYRAARAFSESLYEPMEKAWRGYAEMKSVRDGLDMRIGQIRDAALLAEAKALKAKLEPPAGPNAGFEGESGTLAALETSAEGADTAPSDGLRQIAAQTISEVNSGWAAWQQTKAGELELLNRRLAAAHLQPIVIPPEGELRAEPPAGGEELP
ncbi:MAG TPA: hypothetical protein VNR86_09550, partial [Sphingomicrobium sp.]|nr:hypothetical protein [Sphingomicrobium sp.]